MIYDIFVNAYNVLSYFISSLKHVYIKADAVAGGTWTQFTLLEILEYIFGAHVIATLIRTNFKKGSGDDI